MDGRADEATPHRQTTEATAVAIRPEATVSVRELRLRYHNGALGVTDVSVQAGSGEIVAIFGPNGAGKTTSVRAMSGFLRSEGARVIGGEVTVAGHTVTNWEPHRIAALGVGFVPERRKLFPNLTVADNLAAVGWRPSRARRVEIRARLEALFPILAERRNEYAGRLSGGQQQVLAIARAMSLEPKVLIIDELTLGLHHSLHEPLYAAIRKIARQGTAVVLVDESAGLAIRYADYCYLFGGGQIKIEGPSSTFRGSEMLAAGYVDAS